MVAQAIRGGIRKIDQLCISDCGPSSTEMDSPSAMLVKLRQTWAHVTKAANEPFGMSR